MGYFTVRYNYRVIIYDRRAFIRLATGGWERNLKEAILQVIIVINSQEGEVN